LTEFLR